MTIVNKLAVCLLLLLSTSFSSIALAEEKEQASETTEKDEFHWEVDLGMVLNHRKALIDGLKYEENDINVLLWLSGGLYYKNFFIESTPRTGRPLTIGYTIKQTEDKQFNLITGSWFGPIMEDEQETTHILDGIKDRKTSMEAGVELNYRFDDIDIQVRLLHDVLSRHKGSIAGINVSKAFYTKTMLILPTLGLNYISENAVDYYYGIDTDEVTPIRPEYKPNGAWISNIHIYIERPLSESWSIIGTAGYYKVSDSISDSPIVNNDAGYNFSLGALWVF